MALPRATTENMTRYRMGYTPRADDATAQRVFDAEVQARVSAAVGEARRRDAAQATEVATTAARAAHERIAAILGAAQAQGRREMAEHLALATDVPAETAIRLLSVSGRTREREAPSSVTPFETMLARLDLDVSHDEQPDDDETEAKRVLALFNGAR